MSETTEQSVRKLSDRIETAVFWTCMIGSAMAVLTILFIKGAAKETANALRQKRHPTCDQDSALLPEEVANPSDEPGKPERQD